MADAHNNKEEKKEEKKEATTCGPCVWTSFNRTHNKGHGKYRWYRCSQCGRLQKRALN